MLLREIDFPTLPFPATPHSPGSTQALTQDTQEIKVIGDQVTEIKEILQDLCVYVDTYYPYIYIIYIT